MASSDNVENNRLGREHQMLEINTNIGTPDGFHMANLNFRRLRTRTIPVSPHIVPNRSVSVPLDRLSGEETHASGLHM